MKNSTTFAVSKQNDMDNFNNNEKLVLKALAGEMKACTGGDFGYLSDADKCGLSKHEFAGYLGSLQKKGVFDYIDTDYSTDYGGQFALKSDIYDELMAGA